MNKIFVVLILLMGSVLLSGCVIKEKSPVKYVYEKNSSSYFILYPDGEFVAFGSSGESASGTYRIVDGDLIFTYRPFGNAITLRKDDDSFIDPDGWRYVKTK
jgi:hypothetical protein